jgi:hypothetical protein
MHEELLNGSEAVAGDDKAVELVRLKVSKLPLGLF